MCVTHSRCVVKCCCGGGYQVCDNDTCRNVYSFYVQYCHWPKGATSFLVSCVRCNPTTTHKHSIMRGQKQHILFLIALTSTLTAGQHVFNNTSDDYDYFLLVRCAYYAKMTTQSQHRANIPSYLSCSYRQWGATFCEEGHCTVRPVYVFFGTVHVASGGDHVPHCHPPPPYTATALAFTACGQSALMAPGHRVVTVIIHSAFKKSSTCCPSLPVSGSAIQQASSTNATGTTS